MFDILWFGLIWLLFVWDAIIIGMVPVIIFHRFKMLKNGKNALLDRDEIVSLLFFDFGILFVTLWLFKLQVLYIQIGNYGIHDWVSLFAAHGFLVCFAIGLLMRKKSLKKQAAVQKWN